MDKEIVPPQSDSHHYATSERIDVPGLAERPQNLEPNDSAPSGPPTCANCVNYTKLRNTVKMAHRELLLIERRVDEARRIGMESADRSMARVGAYNVLRVLGEASPDGIPFQEGKFIPTWFEMRYPKHPDNESEESAAESPPLHESASSAGTSIPDDFDPGSSESDEDDDGDLVHSATDRSGMLGGSAPSGKHRDGSSSEEYVVTDEELLGEEIDSD